MKRDSLKTDSLLSLLLKSPPTREVASKNGCFAIAPSPDNGELSMYEVLEATEKGVVVRREDGCSRALANLQGRRLGFDKSLILYDDLILFSEGGLYVGERVKDRTYFLQPADKTTV